MKDSSDHPANIYLSTYGGHNYLERAPDEASERE